MNNSTELSSPVFIVGMNGSGTTMLLDSLGHHPDLYSFPKETRLIPSLVAKYGNADDLHHDAAFRALWQSVLSLPAFEQVNGNQKMSLPADWMNCSRNVASVLDHVFRHFAAREGKMRWCEKTPQHAQHIELLGQLFPGARFIHVVRDGRDCAASFNRRWLRSPVLTMYRWKKLLTESRRQAKLLQPGRYMEVKYESLTSEPESRLRQICAFLDLPFDSAVLQSSKPYFRAPVDADPADTFTELRINSGNWQRYFSPSMQQRMEEIGGLTLHKFGYVTDYPESDADPAPLARRMLAARDATAQYIREIGLKLQGKISRPWRVILIKPFVAYKHRMQNRF